MIGQTNAVNSGLVYYLGSGTSFDVSNIPGYKNFTVDNFLVVLTSVSVSGGLYLAYKDDLHSSTSCNQFSKNYDKDTGIFTISGGSGSASSWSGSGGGPGTVTFNTNKEVYLIKGKVKSI